MSRLSREKRLLLAITAGVAVAGPLRLLGGFDRPVRCSAGHLFTTIWVPFGSLKAIRLGRRRIQRCPVGHHWSMVTPLDTDTATAEQLQAAAAVHDVRVF